MEQNYMKNVKYVPYLDTANIVNGKIHDRVLFLFSQEKICIFFLKECDCEIHLPHH